MGSRDPAEPQILTLSSPLFDRLFVFLCRIGQLIGRRQDCCRCSLHREGDMPAILTHPLDAPRLDEQALVKDADPPRAENPTLSPNSLNRVVHPAEDEGDDAAAKARSVSGSMKFPVAELMGSSRYPVRGSIPDSPGDVMSRSVRHKGVPAALKAARRAELGKVITPEPAA